MYNETRAPEEADGAHHGRHAPLRHASCAPGRSPFQAPAWAHKFAKCDDFNAGRHPQLDFGGWQWIIEYGGMLNTYDRRRGDPRRAAADHLGHVGPRQEPLPQARRRRRQDYKLTWVSHVVGKRESRRLIGDYVMTEHDIAQPDALSRPRLLWRLGHRHPSARRLLRHGAARHLLAQGEVLRPFRSLYSKDVDNLMMAGRCISVSHVAPGRHAGDDHLRAAGPGRGHGRRLLQDARRPRRAASSQSYIAELQQQLLKDGCYLIDLPNQRPARPGPRGQGHGLEPVAAGADLDAGAAATCTRSTAIGP